MLQLKNSQKILLLNSNWKLESVEWKKPYTIKAVEDPRSLNKILKLRPPANILSFNEIFFLWEKKIGMTLEKIYIPEDQLHKNIQGKQEQFHK